MQQLLSHCCHMGSGGQGWGVRAQGWGGENIQEWPVGVGEV